ncbi:MAG: hypothetical protein AAF135_07995 [Bacteroidota bacterium]
MDLFTGEKALVMETTPLGRASWHPNGWICFTAFDQQIWKFKARGDSLTRVTNENLNSNSGWAPDGKSILFRKGVGRPNPETFFTKIKEGESSFTRMDHLPRSLYALWNTSKSIVVQYDNTPDFKITDWEDSSYSEHRLPIEFGRIQAWHPDGERFVLNSDRCLYFYDWKTEELETFGEITCNNQFYNYFLPSPDSRYGYVSKSIVTFLSPIDAYIQVKIFWMDFETGEEWEVVLDD